MAMPVQVLLTHVNIVKSVTELFLKKQTVVDMVWRRQMYIVYRF